MRGGCRLGSVGDGGWQSGKAGGRAGRGLRAGKAASRQVGRKGMRARQEGKAIGQLGNWARASVGDGLTILSFSCVHSQNTNITCEMDSFEALKIVHGRILKFEPEIVARKIIGYIYLQEVPKQEIIRLALGPDTLIQNLIQIAKTALCLPSPDISDPSVHEFTTQFPPPTAYRYLDPSLQNQFLNLEEPLKSRPFPNDYYCTEAEFNSLGIRGCRNSQSLIKTCHYFNKGFCKHGSSCRYIHIHGDSFPDNFPPHMFGGPNNNSNEEDQVVSPESLQKLESEITELLRSRGGNPVSIASLPIMYLEKYGRNLQGEGYLTESQRHGKAGYSLTKLLARMKNSICLIDRPHGQHAVILVEDAHKYMMDVRGERNDPGPIVNGSRQIYLTFPAESSFTEEDVSNYFSTFGHVQDVRVPCQQKRMFGFVTFVNSDTVKLILSKGNPHYICGARVLVKPYREKSKLVERKYHEHFDHPMYLHSHPLDIPPELQARLSRRQRMEEHKHAMELETMRLSQLQLARKPLTGQSCFCHPMDEPRVPQDHAKFPSGGRFSYLIDILNSGSTSDDRSDRESGKGLNQPDIPFASKPGGGVSTVK
ncbi:hypothetical protein RD792_002547 [Penstemon davidsonii]|uniref:Zinc finger CCCH domain-containing protein 18 n=1 Tax=Penstemon davidsonii TaxID=160366 RepID=A0ABR0DRC1_9LAMI|nr:hypothetical protein RD792_002547 [Penstemon davidsonii]